MKVHYLYFFNVLSVFQYDKRPSLKSTPLSELMAGAALNATFINYTESLHVNSIMSANGFRADEIFWNIDDDWFCQIPREELLIVSRQFIFPHSYHRIRASLIALSKKIWAFFHLNMLLYLWKKGEWGRQMKERERGRDEFNKLIWSNFHFLISDRQLRYCHQASFSK